MSKNSTESRTDPPRLLVTGGPTHEPIDDVRYIANRSSGRMSIAVCEEALSRGWTTTLLLGPTSIPTPHDTKLALHRFRTSKELEILLARHAPECDVLIMGAAVADYRPVRADERPKIPRDPEGMTLELEPVPDLLSDVASRKRENQLFVGFALEERANMVARARKKLTTKHLDLIVANPLETMDSDQIEALLIGHSEDDEKIFPIHKCDKSHFAHILLDKIAASCA
ncbi:MAG: phosphopantothenoylcysteine decarboxylase domain-containing protein [Planctomycetota bacterium]|jgi:phosphopantothenoylcysteine decarboxylase/phosphopantothenate--cysteine ligase